MAEFLATIAGHAREEVDRRRRDRPLTALRDRPLFNLPTRGFARSLAGNTRRIIAEVKRASPSKGLIREDFDAVLFIAALLDHDSLRDLCEQATALGLDSIVEVHSEEELGAALEAGAQLVGINNRDLKTFNVDLATTQKLAPLIPPGMPAICESGIDSIEQIRRIEGWGIHVFLIGESLMRAPAPGQKLRELLT